MKKILILLSIVLFSCDSHTDKKKEVVLTLYFTGGHTRKMTFDLPTDAQLYLFPEALIWRSESILCCGHVIKYNVIDYEIMNNKQIKQ